MGRRVAEAMAAVGGVSSARGLVARTDVYAGYPDEARIHRTSATISNLSRCAPPYVEKAEEAGTWRLTERAWTALGVRRTPVAPTPAPGTNGTRRGMTTEEFVRFQIPGEEDGASAIATPFDEEPL